MSNKKLLNLGLQYITEYKMSILHKKKEKMKNFIRFNKKLNQKIEIIYREKELRKMEKMINDL